MNSPMSMLKPPSPVSAITWRERSSACTPLAWAIAVPTAALLNEPMMRCDPLCRSQFADHNVFKPVSKNKYRIATGRVADSAGHSLGMDAVLAARQIRLLVQHRVPFLAVIR
jgi:hypothetical protein